MKNSMLYFGLGLLLLFAGAAIFAPWIAPHDPLKQDLLFGLSPPDSAHWMGRDLLGRDILSRIIHGSRVSLIVGFLVIGVSSTIGVFMGGLAGAVGGKLDEVIMRIIDVLLAFPGILMAIAVMALLGPGLENVILALCITGWVGFARITRAQILSLRERDYILAARALGVGEMRMIALYYLPNAIAPLLIEAAFGMAAVIIAEAGLSFLGLGIQPPDPSWGSMLNEGRSFLLIAPHLTAFPGLCLMLLVLAINMTGDHLRDALSPK